MRYDLTDLQLFVNIVEAGTITGGAARSHLTLASASERLKGMEDALGAPLLLRARKGVALNEAGAAVLRHARAILQQMDRMHGDLHELGTGMKGHVRLLCNTSAVSEHLPRAIGGFFRAHPAISVDLEERASPDIADAIREEACDIGVLSDAADTAGLQAFPFRADPLVLVVPREHPLARRRELSLADVAGGEFVGLGEDSALQQLVTRQLRRAGQRPRFRVRVRSLESVCTLVGQGIGVGIVPQAAAVRTGRRAAIRSVTLRDPWAQRTLLLCVRQRASLPAQSEKLLAYLLQAGQARAGGA